MAYTRDWSNTRPAGSERATRADDELRALRVDVDERFASILGDVSTLVGLDPLINGTSRLSLAAIVTALATKPSINSSNNVIPKRASAGVLSDSGLTDDGTTLTVARAITHSGGGAIALSGIVTNTAQPCCHLRHNSEASITSGNPITFASEQVDVGGMHSTSVNTSRITIPSGGGGVYYINYASSGSVGSASIAVDGGGELNILYRSSINVPVVLLRTFTAGQYFELLNVGSTATFGAVLLTVMKIA